MNEAIDLKRLPKKAQDELYDFYLFLVERYSETDTYSDEVLADVRDSEKEIKEGNTSDWHSVKAKAGL